MSTSVDVSTHSLMLTFVDKVDISTKRVNIIESRSTNNTLYVLQFPEFSTQSRTIYVSHNSSLVYTYSDSTSLMQETSFLAHAPQTNKANAENNQNKMKNLSAYLAVDP